MRLRLIVGLLMGLFLGLGGCRRLNPLWCSQWASCPPHEICDPQDNVCRPRDGAVPLQDLEAQEASPEALKDGPLDAEAIKSLDKTVVIIDQGNDMPPKE
jgi:hypothetical protein